MSWAACPGRPPGAASHIPPDRVAAATAFAWVIIRISLLSPIPCLWAISKNAAFRRSSIAWNGSAIPVQTAELILEANGKNGVSIKKDVRLREIEFDYEELMEHEPGFMEESEWMQYCYIHIPPGRRDDNRVLLPLL